ncbi:hypothetical protein COU57_00485 [Candidatus Pacearchaeota archaeon CG10_big_fil_rev_8_21_14_0_10_32_14]|nr:MAG: hypothetical protein COU57_00485 [Candidatus Pacearchaeota archaeon CG10_big_fil_rev_8_21_14_0_10_32_14]
MAKKNSETRGAMEMSMGTIVTIVLLVSVLVLGLVLVRSIFSSAKGVVDLTDQQLRGEVEKLFSEEKKLVIYPGTRYVDIKQGKTDGVGIGIKNLNRGTTEEDKFSYTVEVSDPDLRRKCSVTEKDVEGWIVTGRQEINIPLPVGEFSSQKVLFEIPVGAPLCTFRMRVNVKDGTSSYATDFFDVKIVS